MGQLTAKQIEVLRLINDRLTVREMAHEFGVSESAVNQRISALKRRFSVNTQRELAAVFRELNKVPASVTCSTTTWTNNQVPEGPDLDDSLDQDDIPSVATFGDSIPFRLDPPWEMQPEPTVVPRVLDGKDASWLRGAAIVIIVLGILATIILGLGAAQGVTEAIRGGGA